MSDVLQGVATLLLGALGLWIGNNYRRHLRTALAAPSAAAHEQLWSLTGIATPDESDVLQDAELRTAAATIRRWYIEGGSGMYLSPESRTLLFTILPNFTAPADEVRPAAVAARMAAADPAGQAEIRSCAVRRQLSLLRTQLKNDMAVHLGRSGFKNLRADERELLRLASIRVPPAARPVDAVRRASRIPSTCTCGTCPG